jgi:opacity protein-like surface antigen
MRYGIIISIIFFTGHVSGQPGRATQNNLFYRNANVETRLQLSERNKYLKINKSVKKKNESLGKIYNGRLFITINYGSTFLSKGVQTTPDTVTFVNLTKRKGRLDAGCRYFLNEHLTVGASVGFILLPETEEPIDITFERPRRVIITGKGNGGALINYGADLYYYFLKGDVRPFIRGSLGNTFIFLKGVKIERTSFAGEKQQENIIKINSLNITMGGGLMWRLHNRWALQGEVRYLPGVDFNKPAGGINAYRGVDVSAGVSYIFKIKNQ